MPVCHSVRKVVLVGAFLLAHAVLYGDDWPEWRGAGRTGVWNETGILDTFPADGLKVRWRTGIYAGYAGPSVSAGRVFLTDSRRTVGNRAIERAMAIDEQTGAVLWTHESAGGLYRPAIDLCDRTARHADRGRRSRLRPRRHGTAAGAQRHQRTRRLAEGFRARLRGVGAVVGHGRGAAGRWRSIDCARRRRAQREGDRVQQAHWSGNMAGAVLRLGARL